MNFELFSSGASWLHRLDARVKIVACLALIAVIALSRTFPTTAAGLAGAAALVLSGRLALGAVLRRLLLVNGLVLFLWLTLPLTYPGAPAFSLGPLDFTREGIVQAALISIKTNAAVLTLMALIATSPVAALGHALAALKVPEPLCLLLLFSYRYISVIHQEYLRLVRAARLRGFRAGANLHSWRTTGYLFGMTLIKSHHRAHRVRQAMVLRGFQGRFYSVRQEHIGRAEIGFGVCAALAVAGLLALEISAG